MNDTANNHVYHVDKFSVPASSRDEFLARALDAKDFLKCQEGFVRGTYLEQFAGPGAFNLVTIVEWKSQAHMEQVKAAMGDREAQAEGEGVESRQQFCQRLGIKADPGSFREV
jgi:heme-degrading monooxygenase HmoA